MLEMAAQMAAEYALEQKEKDLKYGPVGSFGRASFMGQAITVGLGAGALLEGYNAWNSTKKNELTGETYRDWDGTALHGLAAGGLGFAAVLTPRYFAI